MHASLQPKRGRERGEGGKRPFISSIPSLSGPQCPEKGGKGKGGKERSRVGILKRYFDGLEKEEEEGGG